MRQLILIFALCGLSAYLVGCAENELIGHRADIENQCIHKELEVIEYVQARKPEVGIPAEGCYYRASDDTYWVTNNLIPEKLIKKSSLVESEDCPSSALGYCESNGD